MRLGPLTANDLPAGHLRVWETGPTEMVPDTRRASPDQRQRVTSFAAPGSGPPETNPWIGWKVFLPHARSDTISESLQRYVNAHESLRTCFDVQEGSVRRSTVPQSPPWNDWPLGATRTPAQSLSLLHSYFDQTVTPLRWPNYGFVSIEPEGAETPGLVLVGAFDHVVYDGVSAYTALSEICQIHDAVACGQAWERTTPSHVDFADDQAQSETPGADTEAVGSWRRVITNGEIAPLPSGSGVSRDALLPMTTEHHRITDADVGHRYRALAKAAGVREGAAFCAALANAVARAGDPVINFLLSVHGRPAGEWLASVGWFSALSPISLDLNGVDDPLTAGKLLQDQLGTASGCTPLAVIAEALHLNLQPSLVISYMRTEAFPGHDQWGKHDVKPIVANPPPGNQMHVWISLLHDALVLDVRYPDSPTSRAWVSRVAGEMRHVLHAVTDTP